mmetsp:Transcript_28972/g.61126  ORF Transcript_28972/g.61126 Transcript_28972/m.61126 type:complete len:729 (-) Transcript_28972:69-2255(-)
MGWGGLKLVDLLHSGAGVDVLLEGRHVVVLVLEAESVEVVVDGETELDHPVDSSSKGVRLVQAESRGEQGGFEEQEGQVLDGHVALVGLAALSELLDDGVVGVELEGLLGAHVAGHGVVPEGLGLHDALHVGAPAVLAGDETAWGVDDSVRDNDLLDLVPKNVLHEAAQGLELSLDLLLLLLLVLGLVQLQALLGAAHELLPVVLLELLDGVLIDGVDHEEHLESALLELLQEGRVLDGHLALSRDVVDVLLVLLHAGDVVLQAGELVARLSGVVPEELGQLVAVLVVLVDTELEVLSEGLVELGEVVLVLGDLVEHLETLLDQVLPHDLEDLVLLQHFTRNVQGQVLRVDDSLDEAQVLWHELLAVVHDEHAPDVQLDVVRLLLVVEHVKGGSLWGEEDRLELELSLDGKVLHGEVLLPVVGETLVEGGVLVLGDLLWVPHPDGLLLVHQIPLVAHLLHLLRLLLLGLVVDLLDLALLLLALLLLGRRVLLGLVVADLLLGGLLRPQGDGVADELAVLLDEVLDALLLEVLELVLLQVEHHLRAALHVFAVVPLDGEGAAGLGLPDVLLVVVVLGGDHDAVGHEVGRVETHAELADHADVGAGGEGLHEGLGARARDGAQVVHQVGLGHAQTRVDDRQGVVGLVRDDVDEELRLGLELALVREPLEADLVQGIGGVRNQLSEEDLLVAVERVDDQTQKLVDLSLEGKGLSVLSRHGLASFLGFSCGG